MKKLTKEDLSTHNAPHQDRGAVITLVRKELKNKGITDYWSLCFMGPAKFTCTKFGILGTGTHIATLLLGRQKFIRVETLIEIAHVLEWVPTAQQKILKYKKELRAHGIIDHWTLKNYGILFFKLKFSITNRGAVGFINMALNVNSSLQTVSRLDDLSRLLNWFPSDKELRLIATKELAKHKIKNYWTLISHGTYFQDLDFGYFGKGLAFMRFFTGDKITERKFSKKLFDVFATWLDWMPTEDEKIDMYRRMLKKHNVNNYESLINLGHNLGSLSLGVFGKGVSFQNFILGDNPELHVTTKSLKILASKLGWKREPDRNNVLELLSENGIRDHWTLINFDIKKLRSIKFEGVGNMRQLARKILKRPIKNIYPKILDEISVKLKWYPNEKQKRNRCIQLLKEVEIVDYWSLKYKYSRLTLQSLKFGNKNIRQKFSQQRLGFRVSFSVAGREALAAYLGWLPTEAEKIKRYKEELKKNGLVNHFDLMRISSKKFSALSFGFFGTGDSFIKIVLEKSCVKSDNSSRLINELAKKLDLHHQ